MSGLNHYIGAGDEEAAEVDGADNFWTEKLESYFIYSMVDEIAKGNMQTATFANAAWKTIVEALRKKSGKEYTYNQLKNKYHNLRARWKDFSNLIKEKEIRYNPQTGEVTARDDVWLKLYPRHRRAKSFRKKGLKDYDKLCIIFGCPEVQSVSLNERNKDQLSDEYSEGRTFTGKRSEEISPKAQGMAAIMGERSHKKQKPEKKTGSTASLDSVGDIGNGYGSQSVQIQDVLRCMEALNSLEDINGPSYVKATKYIHDDYLWRKMFLCMPDDRKKDWVLNI